MEVGHRLMAGTLFVAFLQMTRTGTIRLLQEQTHDLPPTLAI
jgi:hypothetical protein